MKCKENNIRLRILLLEKLLLEYPEGRTMTQILNYLHQHEITVERKAIYTDLQALTYLYDVNFSKKGTRYILKRLPNDTFKEVSNH